MDCPKCVGRLQKKELQVAQVPEAETLKGAGPKFNLEVDQCFVCGGVWFDKGELEKYTTEKLSIIDSASLGKETDEELNKKEGKCPRCQVIMRKIFYEKERSITIDLCEQCGGVWLDSTEIDRIERVCNKEKFGFFELIFKKIKRKP